jgi:hypothetical protein
MQARRMSATEIKASAASLRIIERRADTAVLFSLTAPVRSKVSKAS